MPTVEIPRVGEVEFPDSMSLDDISKTSKKLYEESFKTPESEADFSKGRVASGVASAARGFIGGIGESIAGLGRLESALTSAFREPEGEALTSPEDRQRLLQESKLKSIGEDIESGAKEAYRVNPEFQGEFLSDVLPSAIGSTAAAAAAGAVTGPLGAAAQYGLSQAESMAKEAEAAGKPEHADLAFLAGLPLGAITEAGLGAAPAFWKIVKKLRQSGVDPKIASESLGKMMLKTGMFEAGQEGLEQVGQNLVAKGLYDPQRGILQDVPQSMAAGAVVGGLAGAGGAAVGSLARREALNRVSANTAAQGAPKTAQALSTTQVQVPGKPVNTKSIADELEQLNKWITTVSETQAEGMTQADKISAAIDAFYESSKGKPSTTEVPSADQVKEAVAVPSHPSPDTAAQMAARKSEELQKAPDQGQETGEVKKPIVLGIKRKAIRDRSLESLSDDEFSNARKATSESLDSLESEYEKSPDSEEYRYGQKGRELGAAQDRFTSFELEAYRRELESMDDADLFKELLRQAELGARYGKDSEQFNKAIMVVEEFSRRGVSLEKALSDIKIKSATEAEVFKAQLRDLFNIVSQQSEAQPQPKDTSEKQKEELQKEQELLQVTEKPPAPQHGQEATAKTSIQSASEKLADITNEAIKTEEQRRKSGLGISPTGSSKPTDRIMGPVTDITSGSKKAEENWQRSIRQRESWLSKIRDTAEKLWNSMTREYPGLHTEDFAKELDILYRARISKDYNTRLAVDVIKGITRDLGPKQYSVFNRIVVYEDLLRDVESGLYSAGQELPTGHADEAELRGDLAKFNAIADATPEIRNALDKRKEFMDALRDTLVERGMLPETVKEDGRYFHHQVLMYLGERKPSGKAKSFREWKSGWQKSRIGSSLDYNREYVEAEAAMIADAFNRLHLQELQAEMQGTADITPALKTIAESQGTTVKAIIPEGYVEWQPKKGSVFYPVQTVSEKYMEEYLNGIRDLLPDDFKEAIAIGPKLPSWIIPKPLAEVLDNLSRRQATIAERILFAGQGWWKQWTLFMPLRFLRFAFNNQTGDIDITIAAKPELLKWWKSASKDLWRLHMKKGAASGDVKDAIRLGVIGSGWRSSELPELSESDMFDAITGRNVGIMDKYFKFVQKLNDVREDTARLGAYRYMIDRQRSGKPMWYGASNPKVVDALPTQEAKAAQVASDLYINYRRSSEFTDFVRSRIVPFAKWLIGNPTRYVQLIKNVPINEGGSRGQAVGAALAGATFRQSVRLGLLYGLFNIWNHLLFPDEEKELGNARRQFHLILGRDKNGNIQTLRAQGAVSDLLSWFGAENIPQDVADVMGGKKSPGDLMKDAYESFISKGVNAAMPFHKVAYETITQRSLFPNVFRPNTIRDRGQHVAKLFSLGTVYNWLAGIPQSPETTDLASLLVYTADPGDAAYSATRYLAIEWARKHGKETPAIIPGERSNALYYYKQALRYGQADLAARWKERYMAAGGKTEGLAQSVRRAHPLQSVKDHREQFMKSLNDEEKAMVKRAEDWYKKVYKP